MRRQILFADNFIIIETSSQVLLWQISCEWHWFYCWFLVFTTFVIVDGLFLKHFCCRREIRLCDCVYFYFFAIRKTVCFFSNKNIVGREKCLCGRPIKFSFNILQSEENFVCFSQQKITILGGKCLCELSICQ